MQGFLIKILLLTLITTGGYFLAGNYLPANWYYPGFYWLPWMMAVVTAIFHYGLMKRKNDGKAFVRYYMGATGLKLFIYLLILLVVAFSNKAMAVPFALCFFFFYLCFTVFEVASSYKNFGGNTGGLPS